MGLSSLVIAIIGIFAFGVPLGILSIVVGSLAIGRIKRSAGTKWGYGFAIAGILVGAFALIGALVVISRMR